MTPSSIIGWGGALPDRVVTNHDLEKTLDTSDHWITERTGISERRIGGTTTELAHAAATRALEHADVDPESIDLLVLATCTPDQIMPASGPTLQDLLGLRCGAFDVNAACSGFVYALGAAYGFLETGMNRVLVVGSDTMSSITDWDDRTTAILFADGAGAMVLERRAEGDGGMLALDLGTEGSSRHILYTNHGGKIVMNGHEVFKQAVRAVVRSVEAALAAANLEPSDITLVVPHQANYRIVDAVAALMGLDHLQVVTILDRTGNTSAGSIPMAFAEAADDGRLSPGDLVLFAGFGAGMSWGTAIVRYQP